MDEEGADPGRVEAVGALQVGEDCAELIHGRRRGASVAKRSWRRGAGARYGPHRRGGGSVRSMRRRFPTGGFVHTSSKGIHEQHVLEQHVKLLVMPRARLSPEEAFGRALREARERADLSQDALASEAGRHKTYISDLERGKYSASIKTLFLLAPALGTTPSRLLRRVEELLSD